MLVGGGGEQVNLRIAARRADHDQLAGRPGGLPAQVAACWPGTARRWGVRSTAIRRTHGPDCRLFDTEAECRAWCESEGGGDLWGGTPTDHYLADNLVGTVDQVIEKTQAFVDAGCRGLILWLRDFPATRRSGGSWPRWSRPCRTVRRARRRDPHRPWSDTHQ